MSPLGRGGDGRGVDDEAALVQDRREPHRGGVLGRGLAQRQTGNGVLEGEPESLGKLLLDKHRRLLEATVGVFVEDGAVVLVSHLATLQDHGNQRLDLSPGIARVVDVRDGPEGI